MAFTEKQIRARIRQRVMLIYGDDFPTYLANRVDAVIDDVISARLDIAIEGIIKALLERDPRFREKFDDAVKIEIEP